MAGKLQLNDLVTTIAGKIRGLFAWPTVIVGMNGDTPVPLSVNSTGSVITDSSGSATVTQHSAVVSASGSGSIPIGAKNWSFTVLTGTATFNGAASLPAGFSDSDTGVLAVAIAYSTDAASTAYVRYAT